MARIAIIGGGLAGTACAYVFKKARHAPVIFEASHELAAGASGNPVGLYNPRFFADKIPAAEFYADAFLTVSDLFQRIGAEIDHSQHGSLHLINSPEKDVRFQKMKESWGWDDSLMKIVSPQEASAIAGLELEHGGLFLPTSGTVCPAKLCEFYAKDSEVRLNQEVSDLRQKGSGWEVDGETFDAIILACGAGVLNFDLTNWLPVHTVRGQIIQFAENEMSKKLKTNLNFGGYITPSFKGVHTCGSTFQKWLNTTETLEQDNRDILANLEESVAVLGDAKKVAYARASLRTASKDRLPIIGSVPHLDISDGVISQVQNMFISTAHGSHGIVTTYKAAEVILGQFLQNADTTEYGEEVGASRFLEREIKKRT